MSSRDRKRSRKPPPAAERRELKAVHALASAPAVNNEMVMKLARERLDF